MVSLTLPPPYHRERTPVQIEQDRGCSTEKVPTFWREENILPLTGFEPQHVCSLIFIRTTLCLPHPRLAAIVTEVNSIYYLYIYKFNRGWVDTRWQQYITHLHTNSTHNTEIGK
jgi:hypothetical protein